MIWQNFTTIETSEGLRMSTANTQATLPDEMGRFGEFGGRFVPETLMNAIEELEREYAAAQSDEAFLAEMLSLS